MILALAGVSITGFAQENDVPTKNIVWQQTLFGIIGLYN